jgi:hypothetical protein
MVPLVLLLQTLVLLPLSSVESDLTWLLFSKPSGLELLAPQGLEAMKEAWPSKLSRQHPHPPSLSLVRRVEASRVPRLRLKVLRIQGNQGYLSQPHRLLTLRNVNSSSSSLFFCSMPTNANVEKVRLMENYHM